MGGQGDGRSAGRPATLLSEPSPKGGQSRKIFVLLVRCVVLQCQAEMLLSAGLWFVGRGGEGEVLTTPATVHIHMPQTPPLHISPIRILSVAWCGDHAQIKVLYYLDIFCKRPEEAGSGYLTWTSNMREGAGVHG